MKDAEEEEEFQVQDFTDVIELWTAVSLYINAGYKLVSDLPEMQLRYIFFIANHINCSINIFFS